MKKLDKNSKTAENLAKAFFGEGGARNRYTYFSKEAKREGYIQISNLFLETADNEKEHAEIWFKQLHGNAMPSTAESLKEAADGEWFEFHDMYKAFAAEAEEGIEKVHRMVLFTIVLRGDCATPHEDPQNCFGNVKRKSDRICFDLCHGLFSTFIQRGCKRNYGTVRAAGITISDTSTYCQRKDMFYGRNRV